MLLLLQESIFWANPPNLYLITHIFDASLSFSIINKHTDRHVPQQREDSHGDELTLHLVGDVRVGGKQADTQRAAKLVRDGGQAEVVSQVDAGTQQGDESQAATQQVVKQQHPRETLGRQKLLHQRVIETAFSRITGGGVRTDRTIKNNEGK